MKNNAPVAAATTYNPMGWFLEPRWWWIRHLLFWAFRWSDFALQFVGTPAEEDVGIAEFVKIYFLPDVFLVYTCLLVLVPRLLLRKKILAFLGAALLTIVGTSLYTYYQSVGFGALDWQDTFGEFVTYHLIDMIYLFGIVSGLRLVLEFIQNQNRVAELEQSKLRTELDFLKSQVSPHFLFNILNGITVLSEKYPEQVTPVIVKLSKVLRYQIYEGEKRAVLLRDEIDHLRNYLALELMRQSDAELQFEVTGNYEYHRVAPMLFLPFVENAVKHGRDARGNAHIDIHFETDPEQIVFRIENAKPATPVAYSSGGVGLKNVRRRLELLYPQTHELRIDDSGGAYRVQLILTPEPQKSPTP